MCNTIPQSGIPMHSMQSIIILGMSTVVSHVNRCKPSNKPNHLWSYWGWFLIGFPTSWRSPTRRFRQTSPQKNFLASWEIGAKWFKKHTKNVDKPIQLKIYTNINKSSSACLRPSCNLEGLFLVFIYIYICMYVHLLLHQYNHIHIYIIYTKPLKYKVQNLFRI